MLHIVRPEGAAGGRTFTWKTADDGHRWMRSWVWTYRVQYDVRERCHYARLHFQGRPHAHSEDRFNSQVEAMEFCHQHAEERLGWDNLAKAAELRKYAPHSVTNAMQEAGVEQGLAYVDGDTIRWKHGYGEHSVDLEGEGVDLG